MKSGTLIDCSISHVCDKSKAGMFLAESKLDLNIKVCPRY